MPPRLRVANTRLLLVCLSLVVAILVWRACAAPPRHAADAWQDDSQSGVREALDGGTVDVAYRLRFADAAAALAPSPAHSARIQDAEAVLARIEADRRAGQQDEQADALEIRALVSLTRIGAAHAKLQHFAEHYPRSSELPALERLTGYHPRPMGRPAH